MVIFLYGTDSYRLKEAREEMMKRYKYKYPSGINFFVFDVSEPNELENLEKVLKSSSFFNEHKLVIISNSFLKKNIAEKLSAIFNSYDIGKSSDITLIVSENSTEKDLGTKNKELSKTLLQSKMVKNFEPLTGSKLEEWIINGFKSRLCQINTNALRRLTSLTGNDSWRLANEIDKLTAYKAGKEVTVKDIESLVSGSESSNVFELTDAISLGNRKKAIELLYFNIFTGQDPYYLLTMIVHHFRNVLIVKGLSTSGQSEPEIVKKTKLHPFVVKKSLRSKFSLEDGTRVYKSLLELDSGFKNGAIDLKDELSGLLI